MRVTLVAPLVVLALASCASKTPPPEGEDLKIDVSLAMDGSRCVVRFKDTGLKNAERAIAWTNHKVIWQVVGNDCGEKAKVDRKALGLKYLRLKSNGEPAPWKCTQIDRVPATGTVAFECQIPSVKAGGWEPNEKVKIYEYVIEGDQVEPADPDIGARRDG